MYVYTHTFVSSFSSVFLVCLVPLGPCCSFVFLFIVVNLHHLTAPRVLLYFVALILCLVLFVLGSFVLVVTSLGLPVDLDGWIYIALYCILLYTQSA